MLTDSKLPIEQGRVQLLWLADTNTSLICEKLLRCIPKKRWVCSAHWGEQPVVAKLFKNPRHAQRELSGVQALSEADIKTPSLLYHGWATKKSLYVVLYEYIQHKHDLDIVWQLADETNRKELLHRLITIMAQLHNAGLKQCDLHLNNFILSNNQIYVLDAADITQTKNKQPLTERLSLQNLGLLFAQLPTQYDEWCSELYLLYTQTRNTVFKLTSIERLKKYITHARKARLIDYGKKAFRSCSQFVAHKNWTHFSVCDRSYDTEALRNLLKDPDSIINNASQCDILKAGSSSTVAKIMLAGRPFIIKRYNLKSIWHQIKRAIQPSRAAKSWRNAQYLQLSNIATAKPVAMLEKRLGPFRRESYFISEYISANHMQSYIAANHSPEHLTLIAENVQKLFADLATLQISHGDMKATNILVVAFKPLLLDLDAMRLYRCRHLWEKFAAHRDQQRFMRNWENQPQLQKVFEITIK